MTNKPVFLKDETIHTRRMQSQITNGTAPPQGVHQKVKIVTLLGFSRPNDDDDDDDDNNTREVNLGHLYFQVSTFMALQDLNARSGRILPELPWLLQSCPHLQFDWEGRDTQYSKFHVAQQIINAVTSNQLENADTSAPSLMAIVGAQYSSVTQQANILASAYNVPMISGSATSGKLDGRPLFGRTIPTNNADARAAMMYYSRQQIGHVANLFIKDSWGTYYNKDLMHYARVFGIQLLSIPYDDDANSIAKAVATLKASGFRHVFAILYETTPVLLEAVQQQVLGDADYAWITAETMAWHDPAFQLDPRIPEEAQLAQALHGMGTLNLYQPEHPAFRQALTDFYLNTTLQQEFLQGQVDSHHVLANITFPPPDFRIYNDYFYDATIAIGLAACRTTHVSDAGTTTSMEDGTALYQNLIRSGFEGVTGPVYFDFDTGSRKADSVQFRVDNILLRTDSDNYRFDAIVTAVVQGDDVKTLEPFVYHGNATLPPLDVPPLEDYNDNLIPTWAIAVGYTMAAMVIFASLFFMGLAIQRRKERVWCVAQPIFLCQVCIGTVLTATAVFFMAVQQEMSLLVDSSSATTIVGNSDAVQEQQEGSLKYACMAVPWFACVGFVVSFSAVIAKTWRLNQIVRSGQHLRRIAVQPHHVMWPFVVMLLANLICLTGWTVAFPMTYQRTPEDNYDIFGRSTESYGMCQSSDDMYLVFVIPVVLVNVGAVVVAMVQLYKARNLPTEFSENYYLTLSAASLLETICLGVPLLFAVTGNPTAQFLVRSGLLCIACMSILLPIFLPKVAAGKEEVPISETGNVSTVLSLHDVPTRSMPFHTRRARRASSTSAPLTSSATSMPRHSITGIHFPSTLSTSLTLNDSATNVSVAAMRASVGGRRAGDGGEDPSVTIPEPKQEQLSKPGLMYIIRHDPSCPP